MNRAIYVSAFERALDVGGDPKVVTDEFVDLFDPRHPPSSARPLALPEPAVLLLQGLRQRGLAFTLFHDFWAYDLIEDEIERSRALLALVDRYYTSSTGRMNDLASAAGLGRLGHPTAAAPCPILVYPIDEGAASQVCRMFPRAALTLLPRPVHEALDAIQAFTPR